MLRAPQNRHFLVSTKGDGDDDINHEIYKQFLVLWEASETFPALAKPSIFVTTL